MFLHHLDWALNFNKNIICQNLQRIEVLCDSFLPPLFSIISIAPWHSLNISKLWWLVCVLSCLCAFLEYLKTWNPCLCVSILWLDTNETNHSDKTKERKKDQSAWIRLSPILHPKSDNPILVCFRQSQMPVGVIWKGMILPLAIDIYLSDRS